MTTGTGLTAALVLGALTFKGVDLAKYIIVFASHSRTTKGGKEARSDAANGLLTLALGAFVGIVVVFLVAKTGFADDIKIGDKPLGDLDNNSLFALGLAMTSLAGVLYDGKKAVDNSDTASKPKLTQASEGRRQAFSKASMRSAPTQTHQSAEHVAPPPHDPDIAKDDK